MAIRAVAEGIIFSIGEGVSIVSIMQIPRSIGKSVTVFDEFSDFNSHAFDALSYGLGGFKQNESRLHRPKDPLKSRREYIREVQKNRKAVGWAPSKALQAECAVYGHTFSAVPQPHKDDPLGQRTFIYEPCIWCGAEHNV